MGQVCAKHNEYYETDCRYCEVSAVIVPAPPTAPAAKPILISGVLYSPCITSFPNMASYQYNALPCTVWKPHAAGYCGTFCTGIPGVVEPGMRLADPNDGHGSLE